jgi:ATP-dependent Clp protease ATP-binding subunit ClpA
MIDDMLRPTAGTVLARFTRDLTAEARAGRLEPVRCRAQEIARVVDILLRQGKNNPALVGPAGVGKTAIAEGLAQRVVTGDVPLSLRGVRILAVDHVSLLAGTTYRGQYEERIQGLVDESTAASDVVLFIDELHNLIGQGTAMGTAMDAANMLKPALVRGDFRVIGATTDDEYDRWVCGDPALERRFQKVAVRELSADETMEILQARAHRLERHHNVVIAPDALLAAVRLTDLFVADRMRPDRAIDALDEACAHAHALARYSPELEALILRRREMARGRGRDRVADERGAARAPDDAARPAGPGASSGPRAADAVPGAEPVEPFERLARDGFAALERFGAEIEAMFAGGPTASSPAGQSRREQPAPDAASPRRAADRASSPPLAELDAEIARRLVAEGMVVRGHDVARVVSVATGRSVTWTE